MSKVLVTESYLSQIANAIRSKLGGSTEYRPGDMAAAILDIPTGSDIDVEPLSVNTNGTYTAPTGKAYSPVTVNVSGGGGDDSFSLTDYIESTGTQWIDTGYTIASNTKLVAVFKTSDTTHVYACVFGVRANTTDNAASRSALLALTWSNDNLNPMWGSDKTALAARSNIIGQKVKAELSADEVSIQTSGVFHIGVALSSIYTPTDQYSLWLFNLNDHGSEYGAPTRCNMKLYRFRIYEGDTLVHEYIPWTDSNDVVCLKDTVTSDLLYNAGTGVFVRGSDT